MRSFLFKMLMISVLAMVLVVAGMLVRGVVSDRISNQAYARQSIVDSLAESQTFSGVVLEVDYLEEWVEPVLDDKGNVLRQQARSQTLQAIVLPETVRLNGALQSDARRRGIFHINAYLLEGKLTGSLKIPAIEQLQRTHRGSTLKLEGARAVFAVSDPRGLRKVALKVDGQLLELEAGTGFKALSDGAHAWLPGTAVQAGRELPFEMELQLAGTDSFSMVPLARETSASLTSRWPHPHFGGRFLPVTRNISDAGFEAEWHISALASNARQAWQGMAGAESGYSGTRLDAFSVSMVDTVDIYSMSDRATKYAELFIALTLGAFLLFELLRRLNLHPMNYLMIGAALLVFFLMLLSLSERIGFGLAYLSAASACVLLIGFYSAHLLRSLWLATGFTLGLGAMYGALYVILLSEQNALLMGSLLIFVLLAGVMIATRKVDWHALLAVRAGD